MHGTRIKKIIPNMLHAFVPRWSAGCGNFGEGGLQIFETL